MSVLSLRYIFYLDILLRIALVPPSTNGIQKHSFARLVLPSINVTRINKVFHITIYRFSVQ